MKDLDVTKILAKVMQSSYKKKQISEVAQRIIGKMQQILSHPRSSNIEALKLEFAALREESYSLMRSR